MSADPNEPIDLRAARAERQREGLLAELACTKAGVPLPTVSNMLAILRGDPALIGLIHLNEFTSDTAIVRPPPLPDAQAEALPGPYPRSWTEADSALILAYIQKNWTSRATEGGLAASMAAEAAMRGFHPVREWLSTLKWDGTARANTWLNLAFGGKKDAYTSEVGAKFLIAAVRRIRHPGCKFDFMLVLEGKQGIGKSTALSKLFSPQWFSDSLHHELAHKDAAIGLLGVWCVEFGEIDQVIRNELETIKAFLARAIDKYRDPFGKRDVTRPRQGVLVGTTNRDDYLRDETGNRRFWPVRCKYVDLDWIDANRDQLWAEAAAREAAGEAIWLNDADVAAVAADEQSQRMIEDAWQDKVHAYLLSYSETTIPAILADCLSIPTKDQDKRTQMRVASILTQAGWRRVVTRAGTKTIRRWILSADEVVTSDVVTEVET